MYSCFCLAKTVMDMLCLSLAPVTVKQGCHLCCAGFCRTKKENFQTCLRNWSPADSYRDWHRGRCLLIYRAKKLYLFGLLYICSIKDISCRLYLIPLFRFSKAAHLGTSVVWAFFPHAPSAGKDVLHLFFHSAPSCA